MMKSNISVFEHFCEFTLRSSFAFFSIGYVTAQHSSSGHHPNFASPDISSTDGATYIRLGGHQVGLCPTF